MSLTTCRECGTAVPDGAPACPNCGAVIVAPVPVVAQRPLPPRPPPPPPRPWWRSAAEWTVLVAVCVLIGTFLYRHFNTVAQQATEKEEVEREREHLLRVAVWAQDTTGNAPVPESASRPVPTSARAKRIWVVSRISVDANLWRREILKRHGVKSDRLPAVWVTGRYQANARAHPEVGRYLEGRAAAIVEIEKAAGAWVEERILALSRESGLPAREIRQFYRSDYVLMSPGELPLAQALLDMHRHLVRIDPRVHHMGGNELRFEREEDLRRFQQLEEAMRDAQVAAARERQKKGATDARALTRALQ